MATQNPNRLWTNCPGGSLTLGGDTTVNRLGFGAMRLCGPGVWGEPLDRPGAKRVLMRAIELGITLVDTADAYGPEVNERFIAETLYPYPKDLIIATKGGLRRPRREAWENNGRPEHLRAACEASLRRLKLERIDIYQLHAPDPQVPLDESVGALAELQSEGKIRHIGLSNVSVNELCQAQRIAPIVSVQNRYNFSDRSSEDVLAVAELAAKRLGLLRELVPRAARVAVLLNPDEARRSECRYCETWKLLLALTPSSRHQLSRLAPWPRETGLAG
jgi:pyridoxine 4-dehydrogenase